jgi:thioredoxin 1
MLIERLLIVGIAALVSVIGIYLWKAFLTWRIRQLADNATPDELAQLLPNGPALLYFTSPTCTQCRMQQAPILRQLAQAVPVPIHTIDAVEQESLARFYGIMTVPTTIWLDSQQRPAAVNHGLALLPQLRQQASQFVPQM